ncbi:MAG: hypothetical protein JXM70_21930 [Pirellulales bacterium]|nr:hypothetical protein [Pirellulales bacterium]
MRIVNPLNEDEDIKTEIRKQIDSSDNRFETFKWQKLLEFVLYLHAEGPTTILYGQFMFGKLWLQPSNINSQVSAEIWVDRYDYAPLRDGLPETHYRLQISHQDSPTTTDARAKTVEEAEQVLKRVFDMK